MSSRDDQCSSSDHNRDLPISQTSQSPHLSHEPGTPSRLVLVRLKSCLRKPADWFSRLHAANRLDDYHKTWTFVIFSLVKSGVMLDHWQARGQTWSCLPSTKGRDGLRNSSSWWRNNLENKNQVRLVRKLFWRTRWTCPSEMLKPNGSGPGGTKLGVREIISKMTHGHCTRSPIQTSGSVQCYQLERRSIQSPCARSLERVAAAERDWTLAELVWT